MVIADNAEMVLARFRRAGWVASTEDLRTFYRKGQFPLLSCSIECWIENESRWARKRPIRHAVAKEMREEFDAMQGHGPWLMQVHPVKEIVAAIKAARPGTKEVRSHARRQSRRS